MFKSFGDVKAVFVNQDEGMFVAMPITLDTSVHTLETETRNGKTIAKAGSVVKEGTSVKGILAEEYDVTEGKAFARVVLEGYAWASRLTANALAAISSLPNIVVMPYKYISVAAGAVDTTAHTLKVKVLNGAKFASTFSSNDITIALDSTITATYAVNTAGDELTITASAASNVKITAIAATGFVGAASGSVLKGLPIEVAV